MDCMPVFRMLQEVFPEVDVRLLKAVAIEHYKEPAAAINFIVSDVLPSIGGPTKASSLVHTSFEPAHIPTECGTSMPMPSPDASLISHMLNEIVYVPSVANAHYLRLPTEEPEAEEISAEHTIAGELSKSEAECTESTVYDNLQCLSSFIAEENLDCRSTLEKDVRNLSDPEASHLLSAMSVSDDDIILPTLVDSFPFMESHTLVSEDSFFPSRESFIDGGDTQMMVPGTEMITVTENAKSAIAASQSSPVGIDFLKELISDSKRKKNTLVSALESVVSLVKEVDLHEERAKQVKEEASKAGEDILSKADELKQRANRAKEANDVYAGEVYGEKAILVTEARELQSRLVKLSDKREKSLSMVDEIRQKLESRLTAAKEEQEAAELEKLEKEELAKKLFKDQEIVMSHIVQDSERLQHEAEENSKLREFLVDRGHVVDVFQGEVAVICEDILLLKERAEGRMPLSSSISRMSRSPASSISSLHQRSISSEDATHSHHSLESPKHRSFESEDATHSHHSLESPKHRSFESEDATHSHHSLESPKHRSFESLKLKTSSGETPRSPRSASLVGIDSSDDDWELCDNNVVMAS